MKLLFTYMLLMVPWMLAQVCRVFGETTEYTVVTGLGSPLPMSLYLEALFSYRFVAPTVQVTFDSRTSDQALCRLTSYSKECAADDTEQPQFLDWASLVSPVTSDFYQRYPDLQLYPTVAGAVVPIFNLGGVMNLVLCMDTLAKIWSGRITTWDHPDIKAANPNFTAWGIPHNQRITLVARGERAGETQVFKEALGSVDPGFQAQVGDTAEPDWNGTQVVFEAGAQLVISYVMRNRYTLGYASMGDALTNKIPFATLNRSGVVVEASSASVQYAMLERGVSFGNNGDDASHMTADLCNAVNPLAWPITSYAYLAVRKSTLRSGASCATASALVAFWLWFWHSNEVDELAKSLGFSILPEAVRDHVVGRFKQEMYCGGSRVWHEVQLPVIYGHGPGTAMVVFEKFDRAYALANSSVALNYTPLAEDEVAVTPYLQAGGFVVSTAPLSSLPNVATLVLASQAIIGISQYQVTLDALTMAKILNGDITTWHHKDILALNPSGVRDRAGRVLNSTAPIVLLQGPTASSAPVVALLQQYLPTYTGAAILAAEKFDEAELVWSALLGTPHSFSIGALVGQLPDELQLAALVAADGTVVAPSLATAKSCAAHAVFDPKTERVTIANGSCYPLLLTLYVNMERQCPPTLAAARTVNFLQWMFSDTTLDAALNALNLVPLDEMSSAIRTVNDAVLCELLCQGNTTAASTDMVPLLLAVIIPIVAVVLLGVGGCGWWLWRVTEYNRMLRKKFSNDNVAESCAEAIARFDLAAVAWLKEVKEPNKIQQAFLAIVTLLTEVKPYIPDQLLSHLNTSKADPAHADEEAEAAQSVASSFLNRGSLRRFGPGSLRGGQQRKLSLSQRTSRSSVPPSPMSPLKEKARPMKKKSEEVTSSDGSKQMAAIRDWTRRRCTYMCVRFGSTSSHAERRLAALAQVAGRIVDIAKANGATIDAVGVDVVNVHWGVTCGLGASSVMAVHAGLEITKLRETLPDDQQGAFWLQMGIGKGLCDCGTVSSESGHRFFVVWGPEASLAIEIAATNLPKRVLASLLVSPAVYQEVQYTVQCAPRLWNGDVLLWEPRAVLKKDDDDEWMYELKKMNDGASLCHKVLHEAFLLAKSETASVADIAAHIAQLRASHGGTMSPQDSASLDLLLALAHARPNGSDAPVDDDAL